MPAQKSNPAAIATLGQDILDNATTTDIAPVAAELAAFSKENQRYEAAQAEVAAAEAAVAAQVFTVGEADSAQDGAVDKLADEAVKAGEPRMKPFKRFTDVSPSRLKGNGNSDEANELLKVVATMRRVMSPLPAGVKAASDAAEAAAKVVLAESKKLDTLIAKRSSAVTKRDTIGRAWAKSVSVLRAAAGLADKKAGTSIKSGLFGGGKGARKGAGKGKKPRV